MSSLTADASSALPGPEWLRALRSGAHERFASHPLPTDEEEVWRYSRIAQLDLDAFRLAAPDEGAAATRPRPLGPALAAIGDRAGLVVVRDGAITEIELDDAVTRRGVVLADLVTTDGDDPGWGAVADDGTDSFTELNTAFSRGALLLRVPDGVVVDRPIVVMHCVESDGIAVFPRTIVQLGRDSEATVVEWQASDDVVAFVDPVIELDLAEAARLGYVNVQEWGERVWQTGYQASRVARDATLRSSVVALGGDYARVRTDSKLAGRGASSHLQAVYFGGHSQMHDFRTMQDHAAPSTNSDLLFKGAVQDRAQSVYSGLIRVRKEGSGTNAYQTNRNLVLSEGARAESVPNLEIEVNDVRCSHASAVGPIDDDQRFYLESRGVPPEVAERLIVLGFFSEVLEALPTQALIDTLRAAVDAKLSVPAASALMARPVRLGRADDVEPGTAKRFEVDGRRIAVVRIDDDFYAISDRCSHADVPLSEGEVWAEEREIECWKHGSTFSLVTGEPQSLPATQPVPVYKIVREGDDLMVELPE